MQDVVSILSAWWTTHLCCLVQHVIHGGDQSTDKRLCAALKRRVSKLRHRQCVPHLSGTSTPDSILCTRVFGMYVYSLSVLAHNFVLLRLLAGITWRRAIINILPHSGEGSQKYRTITTHSCSNLQFPDGSDLVRG
jgi:hypothetical protein